MPETPVWLLQRNRTADAEQSLMWLRGWVAKPIVARELKDLQQYCELSRSCDACIAQSQKCPHPLPAMREKLRELIHRKTLKPLVMVIAIFAIGMFTGISAMTPFTVQIFKAYDSPLAPDRMAAVFSFVSNLGMLAILISIRFTGKRPLYLAMLGCIAFLTAILSAYGFILLPSGYNSFDQAKYFSMENHKSFAYVPIICLILWNFCTNCLISSMGWQLLSEVFSNK